MDDVVDEVVVEEEVSEEVEAVEEETAVVDGDDKSEEGDEVVNNEEELSIVIDDEEQEPAPQWVKDLRKKTRNQNKEIRDLKSKLETFTSTSKEVELGKKPHPDDYEYGSVKYETDMEAYLERKRAIEAKEENKQKSDAKDAESWQAELDGHEVKKGELNVKNFDEIEDSIKDTFSLTQQSIIIQACKNSAKVMYALGTNPDAAKKLAAIPNPVKFAGEVARLEKDMKVKTRAAATQPEKKVQNNGTGGNAYSKTLDKLRVEAEKSGNYSKVTEFKRNNKKE